MQVWNEEYKERLLNECNLWKNCESDRFREEITRNDFKLVKTSKQFVLYRGAFEIICAHGTIEEIVKWIDDFILWERALDYPFEVCNSKFQYTMLLKNFEGKNFKKVSERSNSELYFNSDKNEVVRVVKTFED